jgi:ribosomal protein S18 acetylase RimI-like enzyme
MRIEHIEIYENHLFKEDIDRINNLLGQLSSDAKPVDWKIVREIMKNGTVFVLRDNSPHMLKTHPNGFLVGKATLIHARKFFAFYGIIEDVVVDENYRGQGLGKLLAKHAIKKAKKLEMHYIDLTSNPKRVAANNLYKKAGFEKRDTNYYRLKL